MKIEMTKEEFVGLFASLNHLGNVRMPIHTALQVVKLIRQLKKQADAIEGVRKELAKQIRVKDDKAPRGFTHESNEKLQEAIAEIMQETIIVKIDGKIKLPTTIPSTCEKCHHNMDVVWQIEPNMLAPLMDLVE